MEAVGLFFKPTDDSTAGNAERSFQSTQTAALFIRAQDFLTPFGGIALCLGMFATLPPAVTAKVLLFSIGCNTILGEVSTAAMPTRDKNRDHGVKPFL